MATAASRIALATGLSAFLVEPTAAMAEKERLPSSMEIGQALISEEYERCRSSHESRPIAQSHCTTDLKFPNSITFEQTLCVSYGADSERNPIARCVFKGEKRIYPNHLGYMLEEHRDGKIKAAVQKYFPPQIYGDGEGAIDLFYKNGKWLLMPEPQFSID